MRNNKYLFSITILFFVLGFVNIHFSLLGILCMGLPFVLLIKNEKKVWCQGYCPRASLYTRFGKAKKWKGLKTPKIFINGNLKWIMLIYFGVSMFFIIMSTISVAKGIREPMDYLRFLIFIPIPYEMPQIIDYLHQLSWVTHLSYRLYSMMMTTTTLGLILAFVYKPRTWCTVCPVATMSDLIIQK